MLTNKIGFDLKNAIENPSYRTSVIQVLDNDGTILDEIPWTPVTDYMYNPKPDSRYQRPFKVKMASGELEIPPILPENTVTTDENPFVQLIYHFTSKQSRSLEEIVRHLIHDKKVLVDNHVSIEMIKKIVYEMYEGEDIGGLLIKKTGRYISGVKLRYGKSFISIYSGYDPFEYQIMNYLEHKNTVSRDEIFDLLSISGSRLKWARYDTTIDFYIKKLLLQGCITKFGKDWYRFKRYPERMT
jgi:hypothetical protein